MTPLEAATKEAFRPGRPSKIDLNKLRELTAQGMTRDQLAEHFNCHPDRISAARKRAGLPPDTAHHGRQPSINYDAVKQRTQQGQTAAQIAAALGCSRRAIHDIRHRLGITEDQNRPLTPQKRALIEAAIRDGWSQAEICRTHHIDPQTMRRHYPQAKWSREQQNEHIRTIRQQARYNWGHHKPEAAAA